MILKSIRIYKKMSFIFKPTLENEGKGAQVLRIIKNQHLKIFDPFLMLDYFHVKLPAGFPDHPHRGFQTITYMLSGKTYHQDCKGHKGEIGPGDIQWMTAGKGIVHSQMPGSFDEMAVGFQLWLNLRSEKKMVEPKYQEYTKNEIPVIEKNGNKITIICGEWEGNKGVIKYETPSIYFLVELAENGTFELPLKANWSSLIFAFEGNVTYDGGKEVRNVDNGFVCVLENHGEGEILHKFASKTGGKFLFIGGEPIGEPMINKGPFAMNTQEEVEQAYKDYKETTNGFEDAKNWSSKIKYLADGKKYEEL